MKEPMILEGAREVLQQGEWLLRTLDDETYIRRVPEVFSASIGRHYRHCLDHFQSVLNALDTDEGNFRRRDRRLESDRTFALAETQRIIEGCESIAPDWLQRPICLRMKASDGAAPAAPSTIGREMMYAVAHAIHHYALIGAICGRLGVALPASFGVAPRIPSAGIPLRASAVGIADETSEGGLF